MSVKEVRSSRNFQVIGLILVSRLRTVSRPRAGRSTVRSQLTVQAGQPRAGRSGSLTVAVGGEDTLRNFFGGDGERAVVAPSAVDVHVLLA